MRAWTDFDIWLPPGRSSGEVKTLCPRCASERKKSRDPSLRVNIDKGVWFCHHCRWKGTLVERGDEPMAYGAPLRPSERRKEYKRPDRPMRVNSMAHMGAEWLRARGISVETAKKYGIVPTTHYFAAAEKELPAIAIPIMRGGVLVNTKYRSLEGKYFAKESGAESCFYGLDDIDPNGVVTFVEGEMDKLACAEVGITNVLSVPDGSGSGPDLLAGTDILAQCNSFIMATDGDEKGVALADAMAAVLGHERCRRVTWPDGIKDANECLVSNGGDALWEVLSDARHYPLPGVLTMDDLEQRFDRLYESGMPPGLHVGIPELVGWYAVIPGQLTVITGSPGSGKSAFSDQLGVNMALHHDWVIASFSPENWPMERYLGGLAEKYYRKPFGDGPTPRMSVQEKDAIKPWLREHFYLIDPDDSDLDHILERADVLYRQQGISGLIIDPWNTIEGNKPRDMGESQYIGRCLERIKRFGRSSGVHIWLVAHPRKLETRGLTDEPIATPYDISGSSTWYDKPDVILSLHRNKRDDGAPVELHVQKIRQREAGKLGTLQLRYDIPTGRYTGWT